MALSEIEQIVVSAFPNALLLNVRQLEGGVSATVSALELEENGAKRTVVLRQYGAVDLANDPKIASHEGALLAKLDAYGMSVPKCLYVDDSEGRYIIVSFIEGASADTPADTISCVRQMADTLTKVHLIDSNEGLEFLKDPAVVFAEKLKVPPLQFDDSLSETKIREVLMSANLPEAKNKPAVLHGDFWPGNVMMKNGKISGIIDWEDAMFGDPLVDLANGRLEILMLFGEREMHEFTEQYKMRMPHLDYRNLTYWELFAALRPAGKMGTWGLDETTLYRLQNGHRKFVDQAIDSLTHS